MWVVYYQQDGSVHRMRFLGFEPALREFLSLRASFPIRDCFLGWEVSPSSESTFEEISDLFADE